MWKKETWNVISHTQISLPNDLIKKSYIIYKFHNFLLYIILHFIGIFDLMAFLKFLLVLNIYPFNLSSILTNLSLFSSYDLPMYILMFSPRIIKKELKFHIFLIYGVLFWQFITLSLPLSYKIYLEFNPTLNKEYEYSDDLNDDDDDEEKEEKFSGKLRRCWRIIKKFFYNDLFY
ncbi:hypothetical protein C1645_810250 [Glomus cerebriforme]|uniref:Uncharacterized protein n=1 Tax=Glomus cerebriforme TaxID=658196 RepID=A0A397S3G3_9GLOM|nr:hypothetical protein C1645_810250 [Glomus cerebriforme]